MIQVLALRAHASGDGQARAVEAWFERGIRAASVEDILLNPKDTLERVEASELYNIYYTVAECHEESGRKFLRQHHIPFDVDGIDVPDGIEANPRLLETTARLICAAIGVEFGETGVVYTGNGLQFLVGLEEPFEDPAYFDQARKHYRAICDRITLRLQEHNVAGKADSTVWSPARILRHPDTRNRKPGKPERFARVVQGNILRGSFKLEEASGLPQVGAFDQINSEVAKTLFTPDQDEIMHPEKGCRFLSWAQDNPKEVSEPQWYAALSIVGRFPNGRESAHAISKGHPKYSYSECELKAKQALEASGPRTCDNINSLWSKCQTCVHFQKITSPIAIVSETHIKTINSGFYHVGVNEKTGKPVRGKPAYEDLLKFFQRQHEYVSVINSPEIYTWNGKFWEEKTKDHITVFAQEHFEPKPTKSYREEFYGHVKNTNTVTKDWFENRTSGLFNFQNGVFDVTDNTLKPHFKDSGFKFVLPCAYDAQAQAPRFEQFMREITCNREDLQLVLQEFMGYCLSGMEPLYEKAAVLLGIGANGKSTFVNVLRALCGKSGYSSLSVKSMQSDQKRYLLMNKLVNIAEENSRDSFKDTELIKNFISGGEIDVKQLYSQPFEFKNNAKLIILCNELPRNLDQTSGFYRKLMILPFDARFDDNRDVNLKDKLLAELPGIFNYAIEGYRRLRKQNGFTDSATIRKESEEYSVESNEIKSWFIDEIEYMKDQPHFTVQKQVLFNKFREYCEKIGQGFPPSLPLFCKRLKMTMELMGLPYEEAHLGVRGQRVREIKFLRIRGQGIHMVINQATGDIKAKEMYD
jgi:P4 family phage/plasmid primase-like protien